MKTTSIALLLAIFALPAFARSGGFKSGETPPPPDKQESGVRGMADTPQTSVKQAMGMKENNWVTLEGIIEKQVGDQEYLFRDKTGTIRVKIPKDVWNEQDVSAKNLISISGKLRKTQQGTFIEVGHLLRQ